jgi:5-enolpyruvylshikimate-3-phosphate synthase
MTLKWLDFLGIEYQASKDLLHFEVRGNQKFKPFEKVIPADFSTSLFVLGAALQSGCNSGVNIKNLDFSDSQGDNLVFKFFEQRSEKMPNCTSSSFMMNSLH